MSVAARDAERDKQNSDLVVSAEDGYALSTSPLARGRQRLATEDHAAAHEIAGRLLDNIETVVHGKREQITLVVAALVCGGHALLEDVPGTAKTVLARSIAQSIEGAVASRIQCTPDLQPTDVTGLSIFNQRERDFEFRPGPVFANVVLVDEINRAMPKTQSALLEAMAEQQVTVDGVTRPLPEAFLVLATQNPIEYEGTFPLPEAQLDRFFVRTTLGYPDAEDEGRIVEEQLGGHPLTRLGPAIGVDDVRTMRAAVRDIFVHEAVARWIVELVRATRRQLRPRDARPQPRLPRVGDAARPPLRDARGRRAAVRPGPDAPPALPPQLPGRDPRPRLERRRDRGPEPLSRARAEARLRHRPRRPLLGGGLVRSRSERP
jgi:MoxR-like ATPase